jgi:predicted  nucleic acid-binding Zn-ribbon protein
MAESMTQLQHQLNEYSRRSADLVALTGQLQDYRTQVELTESELERSRVLSEKLRDQLSKVNFLLYRIGWGFRNFSR